jgi:hypothetical protein
MSGSVEGPLRLSSEQEARKKTKKRKTPGMNFLMHIALLLNEKLKAKLHSGGKVCKKMSAAGNLSAN